jgi:acyl-CoA hydrolase
LSQPDLRADQIHPNAAGYRKMAAGIHSALKQLGLAR